MKKIIICFGLLLGIMSFGQAATSRSKEVGTLHRLYARLDEALKRGGKIQKDGAFAMPGIRAGEGWSALDIDDANDRAILAAAWLYEWYFILFYLNKEDFSECCPVEVEGFYGEMVKEKMGVFNSACLPFLPKDKDHFWYYCTIAVADMVSCCAAGRYGDAWIIYETINKFYDDVVAAESKPSEEKDDFCEYPEKGAFPDAWR